MAVDMHDSFGNHTNVRHHVLGSNSKDSLEDSVGHTSVSVVWVWDMKTMIVTYEECPHHELRGCPHELPSNVCEDHP